MLRRSRRVLIFLYTTTAASLRNYNKEAVLCCTLSAKCHVQSGRPGNSVGMFIESVDRIYREYSSVIGRMELDTTSRQVLNTTESVGG